LHQWQVSGEVALPADATVSLGYVGQYGTPFEARGSEGSMERRGS